MEQTPMFAQYIPQSSRKRLFSAGSSSAPFVDSEVTEIPSSAFQTLRKNKQKQAIIHEVIDVEDYVDSADVMVLDEKADLRKKGKGVEHNTDGSSKNQSKESTMSSGSGSQNLIILDSNDDQYLDLHDNINYLDEYAILQAYFDNSNIPTGVEAPVPWFTDPASSSKKKDNGSHSSSVSSSSLLNPMGGSHSLHASGSSSDFLNLMGGSHSFHGSLSSSSLLNPMGIMDQTAVGDLPSSFLPPISAQSKYSSTLQHIGRAQNLPFDVKSSQS